MFTVTAPTNLSAPLTVGYSIRTKARLGMDYSLSDSSGQIVIPAGSTSGSVTLTALPINTGLTLKPLSVIMTLQKGSGYNLAIQKRATVVIH